MRCGSGRRALTGGGGRAEPAVFGGCGARRFFVDIWGLAESLVPASNQIKSLLLSHHHSTSALVSEILMSVLQTVQKNNRQFTYGQTVQKTKKLKTTDNLPMDRQCKKLHWSIYSAPDSAKKTKKNSNLHMDSTYLQTVQKTMCKIHIHILSTHSVL